MTADNQGPTTEGARLRPPRRELCYLDEPPPAAGEAKPIAEGLLWARVPLPMELSHINLWLMEDQDGWTLVDTGMSADVCRAAWRKLERGACRGLPLRRVFLTHDHPDHMGLASWLAARHEAQIWMSKPSHRSVSDYFNALPQRISDRIHDFVHSHGMDMDTRRTLNLRGDHRDWFDGIPAPARYPEDGDELRVEHRSWQIIATDGHCRGHLCLHDQAGGLLISGDQVLPAISPNVSVISAAPEADPLRDFLASLARLERLPEHTLVLPSHGRPFRALHQRVADLRAHHEQQLQSLVEACAEPRTAHELLPVMFGGTLRGFHRLLALGEAVAHLNYLRSDALVSRCCDKQGIYRFQTV